MIGLLLPLNIDTNTVSNEFRNRPIDVYPSAITRLYEPPISVDQSDLCPLPYQISSESHTRLDINGIFEDTGSTWKDISVEDFDVVSKMEFSKSIIMKVKIKSISKFIPKIVVE